MRGNVQQWEYATISVAAVAPTFVVFVADPDELKQISSEWELLSPAMRHRGIALNLMGKNGWELVSHWIDYDPYSDTYSFKRPI